MDKINVGDAPGVVYSPPWIGFLVILIGLAYEIFRPSLNLKRDTNWKWILAGGFLFLIIMTMIVVQGNLDAIQTRIFRLWNAEF